MPEDAVDHAFAPPVSTLEAGVSGRLHRALEPLHAFSYFAPEVADALVDAGLRPGRMTYFASRSAAMGAVPPAVTTATFYNFNPELVARHLPRAWTLATPQAVLDARLAGVDRGLRRLLGDDVLTSPELVEAAELARASTAELDPAGRTLFAAHAALDWPDEPHLQLWQAVTLLREFRGDGHLAALLHAGLSGVDAIVTHTATGRGFLTSVAQNLRGWSDEEWQASVDRLASRGLTDGAAALTEAGVALRARVEADTDRMDQTAWLTLGPARTERLLTLGKGLSRIALANGAFPPGVFATPS